MNNEVNQRMFFRIIIFLFVACVYRGCTAPDQVQETKKQESYTWFSEISDSYVDTSVPWILKYFEGTVFEPTLEDIKLTDKLLSEDSSIYAKGLEELYEMGGEAIRVIFLWQVRLSREKPDQSDYFDGLILTNHYTSYRGRDFDECIKEAILNLGKAADQELANAVGEWNPAIDRFVIIAIVLLGVDAPKAIERVVRNPTDIGDLAEMRYCDPFIMYDDYLLTKFPKEIAIELWVSVLIDAKEFNSNRIRAAWVLKQLGPDVSSVLAVLIDKFQADVNAYVGDLWIEAISAIDETGDQAIPFLMNILDDKSLPESNRIAAYDGLRKYGERTEGQIPTLVEMLRDTTRHDKFLQDIHLSGGVSDEELPILLEALLNREYKHPNILANVLAAYGPHRWTISALTELLTKHHDYKVRLHAAEEIHRLGPDPLIEEALTLALSDENPEIVNAARESLAKLAETKSDGVDDDHQ